MSKKYTDDQLPFDEFSQLYTAGEGATNPIIHDLNETHRTTSHANRSGSDAAQIEANRVAGINKLLAGSVAPNKIPRLAKDVAAAGVSSWDELLEHFNKQDFIVSDFETAGFWPGKISPKYPRRQDYASNEEFKKAYEKYNSLSIMERYKLAGGKVMPNNPEYQRFVAHPWEASDLVQGAMIHIRNGKVLNAENINVRPTAGVSPWTQKNIYDESPDSLLNTVSQSEAWDRLQGVTNLSTQNGGKNIYLGHNYGRFDYAALVQPQIDNPLNPRQGLLPNGGILDTLKVANGIPGLKAAAGGSASLESLRKFFHIDEKIKNHPDEYIRSFAGANAHTAGYDAVVSYLIMPEMIAWAKSHGKPFSAAAKQDSGSLPFNTAPVPKPGKKPVVPPEDFTGDIFDVPNVPAGVVDIGLLHTLCDKLTKAYRQYGGAYKALGKIDDSAIKLEKTRVLITDLQEFRGSVVNALGLVAQAKAIPGAT